MPQAQMKNEQSIRCPALFLSAPASGQGKTTVTASLARLLSRQGKKVRIFKTGPDYLDPQILSQASGFDVIPLDLWMAGDAWCQNQLYLAAQTADLILIEGAMGMYDGSPSSADLAARFSLPMAIIMDVKGMAQTAAAIASGLAHFRDDVDIIGLIANNCGSQRHRELIEEALPEDLPLLLSVPRAEDIALPERHLGLVQASEVSAELEQRFEAGADRLEAAQAHLLLERIPAVEFLPAMTAPLTQYEKTLQNITIAVAKDKAFSFIYDANIQLLENLGANIVLFSPLDDSSVPTSDALWLPGGYPELHASKLSSNHSMIASIKQYHQSNQPILAECGGFLYILNTLTDLEENTYPMAGLLDGDGMMRGKRGCQGMQIAPLPEGDIRGHAHHRSRSQVQQPPIAYGKRQRHPAPGEAIYREGSLTATYLHLFFASNVEAIVKLFSAQSIAQTGINNEVSQQASSTTSEKSYHVN